MKEALVYELLVYMLAAFGACVAAMYLIHDLIQALDRWLDEHNREED